MSEFYLKVEAFAGRDIHQCAKEAIRLANFLGVVIEFGFNGVTCGARPGDNWELLVNAYHREVKRDGPYKIAYGN